MYESRLFRHARVAFKSQADAVLIELFEVVFRFPANVSVQVSSWAVYIGH